LCAASVAFSFWSYKETIPPVTPFKKNVLAILRSFSFLIVLFILFEPLLSLTYQKKEDPIVAVLIDQSESMSITDPDCNRPETVKRILHEEVWRALFSKYQIEYYGFSDKINRFNESAKDSLSFKGNQTDIASSLESLKKQMTGKNFAAAIIVSDGQYNLGVHPVSYASTYGIPLFTVGVGDPVEPKDIAISQVIYNDVVYLNNKIPVDVSMVAFGYKGKPVSVQLISDGKVIQTRYLNVPEDGAVIKASFDFQVEKIGLQKFVVSVSPLTDELTVKNNSKAFFIKVVKNRLNIALISGTPGPEHSFLYKTLIESPDVHVKARIEKKDGSFVETAEGVAESSEEPVDAFIFNNYPTVNSDPAQFQKYVRAINDDRMPFLLFCGPQMDLNKFQQMKNAAPANIRLENTSDEIAVYPSLSLAGKNSVIMKVSENPSDAVQQWQELPPMWIGRFTAEPKEGSEVLVRVDMSRAGNMLRSRKDIPLILSKRTGQNKSLLVMPYGFWKSYFVMSGLGKSNAAYSGFLINAVKWLAAKDDSKPVIIQSSKNIYRNSEKILFTGQVYDEQYNPVNDAAVKVKVRSSKGIYDVGMESAGNGRYVGSLNGLEVGDYEFEVEAIRQDMILGKDRGKLAVEDFSVELLQTGMNEKLLRAMAVESGGQFFLPDDFSESAGAFNFQPLITDEKIEIDLWNKIALLFLLTALLSVEWFIRKRADML
jgi:hypothetical protein